MMIWLGIETSCDETACAIVQDTPPQVLSNPLYSQLSEHAPWGGVVPELASRTHLAKLVPIADQALHMAGLAWKDMDAIAYTRGPGLMGPLLVGASFAQGLARDLHIPAYGTSHLEGHMAAAWLSNPTLTPPFVSLTVSGGHTELVLVEENFRYTVLGRTRDDAAGEAFDKCGKIMGLGYPAGPQVSALADTGNKAAFRLPRGLWADETLDFSFSGLKTAVARVVQSMDPQQLVNEQADLCASLQVAIVDVLVKKSLDALKRTGSNQLVLCGGVSANRELRARLQSACAKRGFHLSMPTLDLCTDNGAMIAAAAILRHRKDQLTGNLPVKPWLPLDEVNG